MPGEAYSNPPFIIPVFGYTWSPPTKANGNAQAQGFYPAKISRGRFLNLVPDVEDNNSSRAKVKVTGSYNEKNKYFPIQNAFRPLQNPSNYLSLPPSDFVSIFNTSSSSFSESDLLSYAVTLPTTKRVASIQLEYSFSVDPKDQSFLDLVTDKNDLKNIADGNYTSVDLNKYLYLDVLLDGKVYTAKSGVESKTLKAMTLAPKQKKYGSLLTGQLVSSFVIYLTSGITTNITDKETGITTTYYYLTTWDTIDYIEPKVTIKGVKISSEFYSINPSAGTITFFSTLPNIENYLYEDIKITLDKAPKLLPLTNINNSTVIITKKLRFEDSLTSGLSASNYPQAKEIKLIPNKQIPSLRLDLRKFSVYEATNGCNIDDRCLPAQILSYAVLVSAEVDTGNGLSSLIKIPSSSETKPTINVKVFNPDNRIKSPGFSHSVDLRFYCASVPIDPGIGSLLGLGSYFVTLLAVGVGRKHAKYVFDGRTFDDNIKNIGKLTEFRLFSFKKTFLLEGSGTKNDLSLDDTSLGIFLATDDTYPLAINNGVTFTKGTFKTAFNGVVDYKNSNANSQNSVSHIYFRFWFVPKNLDTKNQDTIRSYRDKTEFIFKVVDGKTTVERNSPASFYEVMVSPPLYEESQDIQIARFISEQKKLSFPGINFTSAVLAVEVFVKTAPTGETKITTFPKISFKADSDVTGIETNIFQNISHTMYPMRSFDSSIFTNAQFLPLEKPLYLTNLIVGNYPATENSGYIQYDKKFSSTTASSAVVNAFKGLLTLQETGKTAKVRITLTERIFNQLKKTPQVDNSTVYINSDFVTDTRIISNGKVNDGNWKISLSRPEVDNDLTFKIQLSGYFVSTNGVVVSRIFKSPLLDDKTNITYEPKIQIPFYIDSTECQFVLRITLFPYTTGAYTYQSLKDKVANLGLLPGFAFDSVTISTHTIEYLKIGGNEEASGGVGFNEDLPLTPPKILGNDPDIDGQFFFVASDDVLGTKTVSSTNPLKITGTLYSPTWFINMPEDAEVKFNSSFVGNSSSQILFRSVLGVSKEDGLSAVTSHLAGNISVAFNSSRTNAQSQGETDVLSLSGNNGTYESFNIKNYSGAGDTIGSSLKGQNPQLLNFKPINNSNTNRNSFYLMNIASDNNGTYSSVAINNSSGSKDSWALPGSEYYESPSSFEVEKRLFNEVSLTSSVADEIRNTIYTLSYYEGGSLILKNTQAFLASVNKTEYGVTNYLVAGPLPDETKLSYINLQPSETNAVASTYPLLVSFKTDCFVIMYVSQNNDSIKYKILRNGSLSDEGVAFDFSTIFNVKSTSYFISGLTGIYDKVRKCVHVVFWCDDKLFYFSFSTFIRNYYALIPRLQLISGNFELNVANNLLIYNLNQANYVALFNDVLNVGAKDNSKVPSQRPALALTLSRKNNLLLVWYKDSTNKLVSKTLDPYVNVYDKRTYEVITK
jgi:hypothetical protein